ncbi:MAG: TauD/TfdA family dioxygenase, partial [Myxococcota bacterium]
MRSGDFKATRMGPFGYLVEPGGSGQAVEDLEVQALKDLVYREQIVVLRGFETFSDSDALSRYCERWGEVSQWPFGTVLNLLEEATPSDHIFDSNYVPMHWDGMYRPQVPEFQIFHCVVAPAPEQGGRTTFSNTSLVLRNASPKSKARWSKVT